MSTVIGMPKMPAKPYAPEIRAKLEEDARTIIAKYPGSRSALLPLLHLVQAEEGYVSGTGIEFCAEMLDLTAADVTGVATFYSMYRRKPGGKYQVGVCTNTLCAVMGGDQIFAELKEHLGVGNGQTTEDGSVTLEHIECNAACDYAPVMMVNWEFFDDVTPESAKRLVDELRSGATVSPTRGAPLCSFQETSRILAGFPDQRPGANDAGGTGGAPSLVGLHMSKGTQLPQAGVPRQSGSGDAGKAPSANDAPNRTAASDPANPTGPVNKDGEGE